MIKFLHTGDWQLGMTRHFFSEGVQERYAQSRFDSIRRLGSLAMEEECQFMVVCGDVFESNQVDQKTVARALEALKDVHIPVYLLPGNHDPLNAASVYHSARFLELKPDNVTVIEDTTPMTIGEGIELIGVPWMSKRPLRDLVASAIAEVEPSDKIFRVCVSHGMVDVLSPDRDDPALISLRDAENALSQNRIHYLALGDRHSFTKVGNSGRVWYAGTPEPTDYSEVGSGCAIVVAIDTNDVEVRKVAIGSWQFIERKQVDLNTKEDLQALRIWLESVGNKERAVVKLRLVGTLSLSLYSELEALLSHAEDILGAIQIRIEDLVVLPEDADFEDLGFSGFVSDSVQRLRSTVEESDPESIQARDALALLVRLARRTQ